MGEFGKLTLTTSNDIEVFFCLTSNVSESGLPDNYVLIWPRRDNWNDFQYVTRMRIAIKLTELEKRYYTVGTIGFLLSDTSEDDRLNNGVKQLRMLVNEKGENSLFRVDNKVKFFTMLPSMEKYRNIVKELTAERATEALLAINNLVALEHKEKRLNLVSQAVNSDVFFKSLVREGEAYFAYKNAASILDGLEQENFEGLTEDIGLRFQLPGIKNEHCLHFRFDHDKKLPKRMAVVIGKNGVGKSRALHQIVEAALENDTSRLFGWNDDEDSKERVKINRILAFAPTVEVESLFPCESKKGQSNGAENDTYVWYKRFALNRPVKKGKNENGISECIIQVARSTEDIGDQSRWDIFLNAIKRIREPSQLSLLLKGENPPVALEDMFNGGEERTLDRFKLINRAEDPVRVIDENIYPLSSGEISFLSFAAQVSLHIDNGSLLLLDEPETHLHPNFISQFVALLNSLLEQTGSAAIIATHSVYFVREVFREQVTVLSYDEDGYVRCNSPRLRTFGADISTISNFVFGEKEFSQHAQALKKKLLKKYATWEGLYQNYKNELSSEFLASLRVSMEEGDDE